MMCESPSKNANLLQVMLLIVLKGALHTLDIVVPSSKIT